MTPLDHAISSTKRFGGNVSDYIEIHDWFDETKQFTGNFGHRALRHHAAGIQWCCEKFGHVVINSEGTLVATKMIAEQHVTEDCGFIPTVADWTNTIVKNAPEWMLKVGKKTTEYKMEIK